MRPRGEIWLSLIHILNRLSSLEDVEEIGAMVSSGGSMSMMGGGSSSANTSMLYLILSEQKQLSGDELEQAILDQTQDLDCEIEVSASMMDMSALGGDVYKRQLQKGAGLLLGRGRLPGKYLGRCGCCGRSMCDTAKPAGIRGPGVPGMLGSVL